MEISNLMACDRAFGRHINNCPWNSRLIAMREDFNSRPARERIYRGENEDPATFLKILAQSVDNNKVKLPIVSYFRDIGFGFALDGRPVEADLSNREGEKQYKVNYVHYLITYRIVVAAHSRALIHEVALPLHYYLSRKRMFDVYYRFFHNDRDSSESEAPLFKLPMTILNSRSAVFKNETRSLENITQIHAASAEYQLKAPVFFMDKTEPVKEEIEFMEIAAM